MFESNDKSFLLSIDKTSEAIIGVGIYRYNITWLNNNIVNTLIMFNSFVTKNFQTENVYIIKQYRYLPSPKFRKKNFLRL